VPRDSAAVEDVGDFATRSAMWGGALLFCPGAAREARRGFFGSLCCLHLHCNHWFLSRQVVYLTNLESFSFFLFEVYSYYLVELVSLSYEVAPWGGSGQAALLSI